MSAETGNVTFHTVFMGYQKAEVDDYVARAESELDIQEKRQGKWEEEIEAQKREIQQLNNALEAERSEKQALLEKQRRMSREKDDIQEQLEQSVKKYEQLKNEYGEYRNRMEADGADPKIIQDAILNAQRMSDIVLVEAQQKAQEIREKASVQKQKLEEEGKQLVEEAKIQAQQVTDAAALKCDKLQKEYDRILLDVTGFKAELMKMYRKHMALLAELPQKEIVEVDETKQIPLSEEEQG